MRFFWILLSLQLSIAQFSLAQKSKARLSNRQYFSGLDTLYFLPETIKNNNIHHIKLFLTQYEYKDSLFLFEEFWYNPNGFLIQNRSFYTTNAPSLSEITVNEHGLPLEIRECDTWGNLTSTEIKRNEFEQPTKIWHLANGVRAIRYEATYEKNRLLQEVMYQLNSQKIPIKTEFWYTSKGLLLEKKEQKGTTWHYAYDSLQRLVSETVGNDSDSTIGHNYRYEYDLLGRVISLERRELITMDHIEWQSKVDYSSATASSHVEKTYVDDNLSSITSLTKKYNSQGQLIQWIDQRNDIYDKTRPYRKAYNKYHKRTFRYDRKGHCIQYRNYSSRYKITSQIKYRFDQQGLLRSQSHFSNFTDNLRSINYWLNKLFKKGLVQEVEWRYVYN